MELVRLESWERVFLFLIGLLAPAVAVWFLVGRDAATTVRVLASLGASFIAVSVMFGWSLVKLPAVMAAEAEEDRKRLEDLQETKEQKARKRDALGVFLGRGTTLVAACRKYDEPPPEKDANDWLGELIDYLEANLSPAHVARLNDGASAPVGYRTQEHAEHDDLFNGIRFRVYHLQEFLKELAAD